MLALLMAAQLTAASVASLPGADRPLVSRNGLNFAPSACRAGVTTAAGPGEVSLLRPQDRAAAKIRPLGALPKANKEIAILRLVEGCNVPVVVSYNVEQDGHFAPPTTADAK
jgi:hypothetical protein